MLIQIIGQNHFAQYIKEKQSGDLSFRDLMKFISIHHASISSEQFFCCWKKCYSSPRCKVDLIVEGHWRLGPKPLTLSWVTDQRPYTKVWKNISTRISVHIPHAAVSSGGNQQASKGQTKRKKIRDHINIFFFLSLFCAVVPFKVDKIAIPRFPYCYFWASFFVFWAYKLWIHLQ